MKKATKTIFSILLITILALAIMAPTFAVVDPSGFKGDDNYDTGKITSLGNKVITIVSTAGSVISVIVLVILGIKYMMGSAEEKAEYKKTLLPYIIGAAFVFAASAIAGVIYSFTKSL